MAVVLAALGARGVAAGLGGQLYTLTHGDFERRTQAATGQTSGRWAVLFMDQFDENCLNNSKPPRKCVGNEHLLAVFESLAGEEGLDYVVAKIRRDHDTLSPDPFKRFGLECQLIGNKRRGYHVGDKCNIPAIILFRDGGMYRWNLSGPVVMGLRQEEAVAVVRTFLTDSFKDVERQSVPPEGGEMSAMDAAMSYMQGMRRILSEVLREEFGGFSGTYLVVGGLVVFFVGNFLSRVSKKSMKKRKTTQKND